ncbi:MAG: hypothetical protein NE334_20645 [Lentisphaeraceae bacterium]|nr:hypothetical protein [Lentisphaeraceae bacterium]
MKTLLILILSSLIFIGCDNNARDSHSGHDNSQHDHGDHEGHDHSEEASGDISEQALENMKIKTKKVSFENFIITQSIPAIVSKTQQTDRPVFAPFAGKIKSLDLISGEHKNTGEVLLTIYRGKIPRPELKMIEEILTPASEEFHTAISSLRQNLKGKEILQSEVSRLQKFQKEAGDLSIVPKKDLIDLKYEIEKMSRSVESGRQKLKLHGLNKSEIVQIEKGNFNIELYRIWKNSLKSNNIWDKNADSILAAVSMELRKNRWTVATIGELVAEDLLSKQLIDWFKNDSSVKSNFLEVASLLQEGHTLEHIKSLHEQGAFNPIISLKVPKSSQGWTIESISVKIGQNVEIGQKLLTLSNPETIKLVSKPQASEMQDLTQALKLAKKISAQPLISGNGPDLKGILLTNITNKDDTTNIAQFLTQNSVLHSQKVQNKNFVTWALREGMKYLVNIPIKEIKDVIIVPEEAIIQHGPDKIIFVQNGKAFTRKNVAILTSRNGMIALSKKSDLKLGDTIVTSGAFALQQALVAGTPQAVDPHAGHNH